MTSSTKWSEVLTQIHDQIGYDEFSVVFEKSEIVLKSFQDDQLKIQVSAEFWENWIRNTYLSLIEEKVKGVFGETATILLYSKEKPPVNQTRPATQQPASAPRVHHDVRLLSKHTFDNFIVGENNNMAYAAAQSVVDFPAEQYNPLFIYGSTGLGKTHLMHAIGNELLKRNPAAQVLYLTAEEFMNEMINSIRFKQMDEFRSKYRKDASLLLVDDIHILSNKDRTQEEFFHTFNALQSAGRQIILTSDVLPEKIQKLEPRLRTRFNGGLTVDISTPDNETMLAILRQKSENYGLSLPSDLSDAIVKSANGNIRELEGLLNRLLAIRQLYKKPLTLQFARERLPQIFAFRPTTLSVSEIIEAVAKFHHLKYAELVGKRRTKTITVPRHLAMYLARIHTRLSFPELGREFGGRDHSTIQHGFRKVNDAIQKEPHIMETIRLIEQLLNVRSSLI